jgi:chromosome partitioning protein
MRALAVVNMKGGVGKTTTAVHLAAGFAARGRRVLLVDTDPQGHVGHLLNVKAPRGLREVMLGEARAADSIVRNVRPGLDVLLSTPAAFTLESQLAGAVQRETLLARRLRDIPERDLIVVDTSPAMGLLTYNALLLATDVVMPVRMDPLAIAGARQTLDGVREIRSLWPQRALSLAAIVPVGLNPQTHASRAGIAALAADEELQGCLFAGVRQCLDLTYAAAAHQTIWEYAPKSRAAEDYSALIEYLEI